MTHIAQIATSAGLRFVTGVGLGSLWILFAIAHVAAFRTTGKVALLTFAIAETLIAMFFVLRAQAKTVTVNPREWAVAVLGTFLPLLLRPTSDNVVPLAEWGLMLGSIMQIAGVLSLNRSFAIVPALRKVKTEGMYRLVRHPIYFSYLISFASYLATNYSAENLLILVFSVGLMISRVHFEERHLSLTPEYRAYQTRVRWRLIPFVF